MLQPPRARLTFQRLVGSLQNLEDNFLELLDRLQEKQSTGQGWSDSGQRLELRLRGRFFCIATARAGDGGKRLLVAFSECQH